jgi:hypothetical protein
MQESPQFDSDRNREEAHAEPLSRIRVNGEYPSAYCAAKSRPRSNEHRIEKD